MCLALAVIAERPDILDKIVLTKTYAKYGVYQIRWVLLEGQCVPRKIISGYALTDYGRRWW